MRRAVQVLSALLLVLLCVLPARPAEASSYLLYQCRPYQELPYTVNCTAITSAPASGVWVRDRVSGANYLWHNGYRVGLNSWAIDTSRRCGVGGDRYVWLVEWGDSSGGWHEAWIGDYYLLTGSYSDWSVKDNYQAGTMADEYRGHGTGTCDRFALYSST